MPNLRIFCSGDKRKLDAHVKYPGRKAPFVTFRVPRIYIALINPGCSGFSIVVIADFSWSRETLANGGFSVNQ